MSVKSFLRELIKDGSGQAMPGIKVVNIDNSAPTYVAPADGYARFSCRANGVNDWWVVRTPENNLEGGFAAPGASHQQAPWIPVKKGATISFGTSEGVPVTSKLFIYSVGRGGGKKATLAGVLADGGGLCVRIFSALCSRRFEGAIRVFLRSFPFTATQPSLQGISTPTKTRSSPQQTDSYPFSSSHPRLRFAFVTPKSSTGRGVNHPVTLFGLLRSCLAGKARHTITTRKARTLRPSVICASTPTWANSALLTGGF